MAVVGAKLRILPGRERPCDAKHQSPAQIPPTRPSVQVSDLCLKALSHPVKIHDLGNGCSFGGPGNLQDGWGMRQKLARRGAGQSQDRAASGAYLNISLVVSRSEQHCRQDGQESESFQHYHSVVYSMLHFLKEDKVWARKLQGAYTDGLVGVWWRSLARGKRDADNLPDLAHDQHVPWMALQTLGQGIPVPRATLIVYLLHRLPAMQPYFHAASHVHPHMMQMYILFYGRQGPTCQLLSPAQAACVLG